MPEVSVILPTCDRPQLVGRALASLLAQRLDDFEVLLIDGNRTTAPVATNASLAKLLLDPRVRIIDGRHTRSAATARNVGLDAAVGNWITFLDDDDEYQPEKIAAQHELALATQSPLVLCGYEFVWPTRRRRRQVDRASFHDDELIGRAHLATPLLFHRRHATIRFDETLSAGEDVPYALSLILHHNLRAVPCVPRPLVVVYPQPRGTSVHADKEAVWRACRASWRLARRRFSREGRRALLALGRLERAVGGHGSTGHFLRCVAAVLRTRGRREWRLAVHAVLARARR